MRCLFGAVLVLALGVMGCSETTDPNGTGGDSGDGGSAGVGGGGADGGSAGVGGAAGAGGDAGRGGAAGGVSGNGGSGGAIEMCGGDGVGGIGGDGGEIRAGLWGGVGDDFEVCFYVSEDGSKLTPSEQCASAQNPTEALSLNVGGSGDGYGYGAQGSEECTDCCGLSVTENADVQIENGTFGLAFGRCDLDDSPIFCTRIVGTIAEGSARGVLESEASSRAGGGSCSFGWAANPVPCGGDDDCWDDNECTRDVCNRDSGVCHYEGLACLCTLGGDAPGECIRGDCHWIE